MHPRYDEFARIQRQDWQDLQLVLFDSLALIFSELYDRADFKSFHIKIPESDLKALKRGILTLKTELNKYPVLFIVRISVSS